MSHIFSLFKMQHVSVLTIPASSSLQLYFRIPDSTREICVRNAMDGTTTGLVVNYEKPQSCQEDRRLQCFRLKSSFSALGMLKSSASHWDRMFGHHRPSEYPRSYVPDELWSSFSRI